MCTAVEDVAGILRNKGATQVGMIKGDCVIRVATNGNSSSCIIGRSLWRGSYSVGSRAVVGRTITSRIPIWTIVGSATFTATNFPCIITIIKVSRTRIPIQTIIIVCPIRSPRSRRCHSNCITICCTSHKPIPRSIDLGVQKTRCRTKSCCC